MTGDTSRNLENRIRELLESRRFAVLSTHDAGQPYATLVGFAASDDLSQIVFATPKTTRKFRNLTADPRVALLVSSSENKAADVYDATAVTATGTAVELAADEAPAVRRRYLTKHPYMRDFIAAPTTALIGVAVDCYYLVSRFQEVMELHIRP